jgi:pyrimidine-nucleoside phosphorylase
MAAFLMAVWFQGLDGRETVALTDAMLQSGSQLDWQDAAHLTADKHSTGGVGDKVSLLLAPLAAACGLKVPMLSGRGLGHTGGTLDKLEAIPGYQTMLPNDAFRRIVTEVGCAIVGQSRDIAPADGKIYALRDVTATIDCVPLITASILSKKLAAGPRAIVIDLKTGSGAFMTDLQGGRRLARSLLETVRPWGRRLSVLFSDMSQPLGCAVGHANEVVEAMAALRPEGRRLGPPDLIQLTEELVADMVRLSGLAAGQDEALARVREVWQSGRAFARLMQWVSAQGGRVNPDAADFGLEIAPRAAEVACPRGGWIGSIACRQVGLALADLGGARRRVGQAIDLTAGIDFRVRTGDAVEQGQPLAILHCRDAALAKAAAARITAAVQVVAEPVPPQALVLERMGPLVEGDAGCCSPESKTP